MSDPESLREAYVTLSDRGAKHEAGPYCTILPEPSVKEPPPVRNIVRKRLEALRRILRPAVS